MSPQSCLPKLYKGIALFTPSGDIIYCIDPSKQGRWHLHLCAGLQEILGLPEPPHFLVPGYTATIDRWFDTKTQQIKTLAEIHPPVKRHQAILNAIFGTKNLAWQTVPWQEETCDPLILETYRHQFPQLWEKNNLLVRFERKLEKSSLEPVKAGKNRTSLEPESSANISYVLRLFVSGHNATTQNTLENLHNFLEHSLTHPYTLKVIDVFKHPEQAELNQVSATPTLVRVAPEPVRRIVGNWQDMERVLHLIATN